VTQVGRFPIVRFARDLRHFIYGREEMDGEPFTRSSWDHIFGLRLAGSIRRTWH
jgi:hypothetical protein